MINREKWQRYIDDQCTPEERKEMLQWLLQLPPGALEKMLEEGWDDNAPPMPQAMDICVYSLLQQRLAASAQNTDARVIQGLPGGLPTWRRRTIWRWTAAACLVLLAGISIGLLRLAQPAKKTRPIAAAAREVRNKSSVTKRAVLPDGSGVWLTPNSMITIGPDYNKNDRQLQLQGEGYFEVVHDPAKPFTVTTGDLRTTVLGTHFNIESYPEESSTKISLSEGKVAVQSPAGNKDSMLYLSPGTRACYQPALKKITTDHFPLAEETAWKNGSLVFNDLPVTDVLRRLENRFGKKILFPEVGFKGKRLTATYKQPDLGIILENIAYVQAFHYRINRDTIIIY